MGNLTYNGEVLTYNGEPITFGGPEPAPDPYAPWGGFANWQRLRLLEYV
jgi:hypothetical protein